MDNIIYLTLEGTESFAWVTEIPNRQHNMFRVSFKNGYENIFFTDVETGKWVEEDLGFTELALEIGEQLKEHARNPIHVPKLLTWHRQTINDRLLHFGFFNFMKDKYKMYEIYNANKKYMYTLVDMDNEEWQILGNTADAIGNIDPVFVENVIQILPLYWAKAR
ncbi:MAG: hypothetical protein JST81_06440 [Bacteroidetes bacterium]|jgi:hypothetical protein|nr:hypothetical protein [Bacteroidota bacterium]